MSDFKVKVFKKYINMLISLLKLRKKTLFHINLDVGLCVSVGCVAKINFISKCGGLNLRNLKKLQDECLWMIGRG